MEHVFLNGKIIPSEKAMISPEDRGFLFADGIYEVARWYNGFFFDMEGHMVRLNRSLRETRIKWDNSGSFPEIAFNLIKKNNLETKQALVYLQVTRGTAKRTHSFPDPAVIPTVYSFARELKPDYGLIQNGISLVTADDIRWSRCDIKSVALLPNILQFQTAREKGCNEVIFKRNGLFTECAHSNVFFVKSDVLYTHPESDFILSGISRKNIISLAHKCRINIEEEPFPCTDLATCNEVFITNTSFEIAPVINIDGNRVADGKPGRITLLLREKFDEMIDSMKRE